MDRKRISRWIMVVLWITMMVFAAQSALAVVIRPPVSPPKSPKQELGDLIFNDINLSNPPGVSCATCHEAFIFWADPRRTPTSAGNLGISGTRNAPQLSYVAFSPFFHLDPVLGYVGGQFWDGRTANLVEQAKAPFLNPIEMNATQDYVVNQVRVAPYANLFKEVYGPTSLDVVATAYDFIADALGAYVGQVEFFNFKSKYDYFLAGQLQLTPKEQRGLTLFNGKAGCATCHPSTPPAPGDPVVFTSHTYHNLGLPANAPVAGPTPDLGLGAIVNDPAQDGKFKIPPLRNIVFTRPYGHNGVFPTLRSAVEFMNARDVQAVPNVPEVPQNVTPLVGNLGLTVLEIDDIMAFLNTLTDGFVFVSPITLGTVNQQ